MAAGPRSAAAPVHAPPTLRDRAARAVRAEIAAVAMRLFLEHGFEKPTVDRIAVEAGLSRTSFFRYFATKEDLLLGHLEELGQEGQAALAARPADEPAWRALRHAFDPLIDEPDAPAEQGLGMQRMLLETPSLKACQLGRQLGWQVLLAPEIARRLGVAGDARDPRPRALAAAALGCLNVAIDVWTATDGTADLADLLDQAMNAVGD